jgi:hypothetical protein
MMRALLLLAALAALPGCDDESIPGRVATAQLHGIVDAHVECFGSFSSASNVRYRASKMLDGSCLATVARSGTDDSGTQFSPRGESGADVCVVTDTADMEFTAEGGEFRIQTGLGSPLAIESACTGFNLEAFGVSP